MSKNYIMIMVAFMALIFTVTPVSAVVAGKYVGQGATIFIGEEGLNIVSAMNGTHSLGWYASAANIYETSPSQQINTAGREETFEVTVSEFGGYTGGWYRLNPALVSPSNVAGIDGVAFTVSEPRTSVSIRNAGSGLLSAIDGKTITAGTPVTFKIDTNIIMSHRGDLTITSPEVPDIPAHTTYNPYANFTVSGTGALIYFHDISNNTPTSLAWDLNGDSIIDSTSSDPFITYPTDGVKTVTLKTTNSAGDSTATAHITVSGVNVTLNDISTPYVQTSVITPAIPGHPAETSISPSTIGYMDIIVKSDGGATYDKLYDVSSGIQVNLKDQFISSSPYYWNSGVTPVTKWDTAAKSGTQRIYQNGAYIVYVECNLNGMKDNYNVIGKSVSETRTVTLGSDTLVISINKESVVRGKPFAVTVTGQPNTQYKLFFKGVSTSVIAPKVTDFQEGVITNGTVNNAWDITTDNSGVRTVEFTTYSQTKEQKYTIRAESFTSPIKSDEITVNVAKGGMTLVATGDQTYYLGEEIKFSGTNTETDTTYLFMTGPNLDANGVNLEDGISVTNNVDNTFVDVVVESDDTFEFKWQTSNADLDAGTYTVYAVSTPNDKGHLQDSAYATASISIKKPYVSAKVSQPNIAKGDRVFVEGTAEGDPSSGVQIWILGKNYVKIVTQSVDSDSTYKYELTQGDTSDMASGQYFIVVQHPMQNGVFDIYRDGEFVYNNELGSSRTSIFKISGSGSLQGSDAAEALIQAINDPNIDDTYTKLNVMVEEPLIAIDTIGTKAIGDKFTLTGKTNLAVDDEILIEIYSSSFKPTDKSQNGEFSGTTRNVKVVKSESGLNKFSLDIDTSAFKADEYIVVAQGITQESSGTALFIVQSAPVTTPPTPTPSVTVTSAPLTVPPTASPTEVPTPVVTETTKSPGFGAVFALIGLMGVAFIVVRRK